VIYNTQKRALKQKYKVQQSSRLSSKCCVCDEDVLSQIEIERKEANECCFKTSNVFHNFIRECHIEVIQIQ
jgi:hypothetical protein